MDAIRARFTRDKGCLGWGSGAYDPAVDNDNEFCDEVLNVSVYQDAWLTGQGKELVIGRRGEAGGGQ